MEVSKKTSVVLWTSVAAAATGIIAVAVIFKLRGSIAGANAVATPERDVRDVLTACYDKIHEIEGRLPRESPTSSTRRTAILE